MARAGDSHRRTPVTGLRESKPLAEQRKTYQRRWPRRHHQSAQVTRNEPKSQSKEETTVRATCEETHTHRVCESDCGPVGPRGGLRMGSGCLRGCCGFYGEHALALLLGFLFQDAQVMRQRAVRGLEMVSVRDCFGWLTGQEIATESWFCFIPTMLSCRASGGLRGRLHSRLQRCRRRLEGV